MIRMCEPERKPGKYERFADWLIKGRKMIPFGAALFIFGVARAAPDSKMGEPDGNNTDQDTRKQ